MVKNVGVRMEVSLELESALTVVKKLALENMQSVEEQAITTSMKRVMLKKIIFCCSAGDFGVIDMICRRCGT